MNEQCPIWKTPCEMTLSSDKEYLYDSPRAGGRYIITPNAASKIYEWTEQEDILRAKLSRWIYEQNLLGALPEVTSQVLKEVEHWSMQPVSRRMDYLLEFIDSKTEMLGKGVPMPEDTQAETATYYPELPEEEFRLLEEMQAATLVYSYEELNYLFSQAEKTSWVEKAECPDPSAIITIQGYKRLEELRAVQAFSEQAFVAMWFDDSMDEAWERGFKPAIEDAGYKPIRIDLEEHNEKIDDKIIAKIRRSRFLVADFTSEPEKARGSVYYEAGFAKGLNIPVIFTCRKDIIKHIHFDTRQFNHIEWEEEKLEDLRKNLKNRIAATIGDGPYRNNQKPA